MNRAHRFDGNRSAPHRSVSMRACGTAACGIAFMAKASAPGRAKTRLVPPLSFDEAAALNTAFLKDVADNVLSAARRAANARRNRSIRSGPVAVEAVRTIHAMPPAIHQQCNLFCLPKRPAKRQSLPPHLHQFATHQKVIGITKS